MLAHFLGDSAHADAGEVIDGEAGIAGVIFGEDAVVAGAK